MFKAGGSGGSSSENYEGFSTKVYLNWQITKIWDYANYCQVMGDTFGFCRIIKQMHYSLASVWDEEYLLKRKEIEALVDFWGNNNPQATSEALDDNEYESSMRI